MVSPIDYTLKIADPFQSALQGYQAGAAIRDDRAQQAAAIAEAQKKAEQDARRQAALQRARESRDPQALVDISIEFPELSEQMKRSYDMQSEGEKKESLSLGWQALSALDAGNVPVAKAKLEERAVAFRNSGNEQMAKAYEDAAQVVELDPEGARTLIGGSLAAIDKDFVKTYTDFRISGSTIGKAEAEAEKAGVEAKFAEPKALLDLEKAGWDIKKLKSSIEIDKQNSRIYALNAQLQREGNELKRQELRIKIGEAQRTIENDIKARAAEAESAVSGVESTIRIIDDLFADESSLRAAVGSSAFKGAVWGTKARSAAAKIEQLQNAIASVNLDKLKGAMSDKDILFLKTMETSLDRYQNEEKFLKELERIKQSLSKALPRVKAKYGLPETSETMTETESVGVEAPPRSVSVDY